MSELIVSSRPELRSPVLIAAFRGWNDGGQGATLGGGYLAKQWEAEQFAEIDCENFYDFQAVRPNVSLEDGLTRKIEWPTNTFLHAPIPGLDRDAVILLGVEPNLRWKTYTGLVLEVVQDLGVEPSRYEGPTGIVGILLDACRREGLPAVSLWAAVPHYVSLAPSPRAALALCRRLGELLETDIDVAELEQAAEEYTEQVTEAVKSDDETAQYVEELERRVDLMEAAEELPTGESLAAELTRFLREREEDGEDSGESAGGPAS
jgi:predicted ATP-grasp superfamily ATP-dependent carboligase